MDPSTYNRQLAIHILEWMACACRTLKFYELQDGILFQPGSPGLSEETKLTRSILDLCKPLIEEGPNHTVDFVHYSAKEYDITLHHTLLFF